MMKGVYNIHVHLAFCTLQHLLVMFDYNYAIRYQV